MAKQGQIASPARGFYVIVPPEYRSLGSLPADQFVPGLMERLGLTYYAGLLSAAQYHGAAHHRPQEFQVMLAKPRRPIVSGAVRVVFVARSSKEHFGRYAELQYAPRHRARSTPEATAIDIVGYPNHIGGLDQAATIIAEVAEKLDAEKLVATAKTAPFPWAQRLGYLLVKADAADRAEKLKAYVQEHARESAALLPTAPHSDAPRDSDWKLFINADVEREL